MPPARSFDEAWSDLTAIIKLGRRLRFVLVECESEGVRAALEQKLAAHCEAKERPFLAPAAGGDVLGWLVDQQRESAEVPPAERERVQPVRFFPVPTGQSETTTLYRLNENRDNLKRDLRGVLVLCGLHDFLRRAVQDAPDLWSMREKTFEITAQDLPPLAQEAPATTTLVKPAGVAPRYDAFLSCAYRDWEQADALRRQLEADGIRVFVGDWWAPPDLAQMLASKFVLIVLTTDYVNSRWPEMSAIVERSLSPEHWRERIIPIVLRATRLPPYFGSFHPLDWSEINARPANYQALLRVLQGRGRELPPPPTQGKWKLTDGEALSSHRASQKATEATEVLGPAQGRSIPYWVIALFVLLVTRSLNHC
jgi:TIR domain